MIKTSFRFISAAAVMAAFIFAPPPAIAYKPNSQAEEAAIKAAMAGDMAKAFGIMKEAIDKAETEGDTAAVNQGIAFLKDRYLIAEHIFSDINLRNIRSLICANGFNSALVEMNNRLASRYAEAAPPTVVVEKRALIDSVQLKYGTAPDSACGKLEPEVARESNARTAKEGAERATNLKQANQYMRDSWETLEFCVKYGAFLRGEDFPHVLPDRKQLAGVFSSEIRRRKLSVDVEAVKKEVIRIGMSECSLYASWGDPKDINSSVGRWGVHKQHVYGGRQYVYTENGRITAWQD